MKFVEILPHYPGACTDQIAWKNNYARYPLELMKSKGYTAEIYTLWRPGMKMEEEYLGDKVRRFKSPFSLFWTLLFAKDVALIHAFLRPFMGSLLCGFLFNKKRVLTPTTYDLGSTPLIRTLSIVAMKLFNRVIAITPYEREIYLNHGFSRKKTILLPFAVDYPFFAKKIPPNPIYKRYGVNKGEFVIISVANFRKFKNLDIMLKAFKKFQQKVPKSRFLVVGKDMLKSDLFVDKAAGDYDSIPGLVSSLGLKNCVTVTGSLTSEQVRDLYSISDVFVNISDPEAQGIAVYEAGSSGVALCLSDIGSFTTVFGKDVLYSGPRDEGALYDNYLTYYKNSSLRKSNAKKIQEKMKKWDHGTVIKKLYSIYRSILDA